MAETKSIAELVAENWADQLDQQKDMDAQSRAHQETTRKEIEDARAVLLRRLTDQSTKPQPLVLPLPIQEIVTVLMQQPRFVDPVRAFLMQLVQRVNAAVDSVIDSVSGPTEPPAVT